MTVRPILFSAPMVRAILREIVKPGTGKTQTRRISKKQDWTEAIVSRWPQQRAGVPYLPGDLLWVRETCQALEAHDGLDCVRYDADQIWRPIPNTADAAEQWLDLHHYRNQRGASVPSIHMPRWASRLTLVVTEVRVERLQDITEADAKAEGCGLYVPGHGFITYDELAGDPGYSNFLAPRMGFEAIWTEINGPKSWAENPWIAAVTFVPHAMNVDTFLAQKEAA